jgi:bacillithiol synthase
MQVVKFPLQDIRAFNSFFLDYIEQKEILKPFYNRLPLPDSFRDQITDKSRSFSSASRKVLVDALNRQYVNLKPTALVNENIQALGHAKTFTITTGHQLNIFTGPLYFIYKIVTVINTCKRLREQFPEYRFVPVYWMASEDHDYDEIKYFRLYGEKHTWITDQKGAVGRFAPNGLAKLAVEIPGENRIFQEAYSKGKTLSEAVRYYVNALFGDSGLVILDGDDADLKASLRNVIRDDIFGGLIKTKVDATNAGIEKAGYETQIFCRDINFFYLDNNLRGRIEKQQDNYKVLDSSLVFSKADLESLIQNNPEHFSPNVVLRPLYQEMILPNLAYIGGPAEIVYWLQLKELFDHYSLPFPILMPRNFAMVMTHEVSRKLTKIGLELKEIFEEKNFLFNHWILKYSPRNLTVGSERESVIGLFGQLRERAELVDKSLSPFVGAEGKRALNSLEKIERKLLRAEKRLHNDKLRQIESVKDALFPGGNLQERSDNFLNFYQQDNLFINKLLEALDPFDYRFHVLTLDN